MSHRAETSLTRLLDIIGKLRSPDGCLWDRKQKKEDIIKYLLEETYELVDAIGAGSPQAMKEEMGDVLFQILFLARIAEEAGEFTITDVMEYVAEKMIRRHPHVFGNVTVKNIEEIGTNWEDIKKNNENKDTASSGFFDRIPRSLPSLMRTQKITEKASTIGFDWENTEDVLAKIEEELREFKSALVPCNIISFVFIENMIYWRQLNEGGRHVAEISSNFDKRGAKRIRSDDPQRKDPCQKIYPCTCVTVV